jgi:protein gp37
MGDKTGIEWTDATWNPVTGCDEVSPGCDHCYAKSLAERFRGTPGHYYEQGFDVVLRPDKLDQPLRWKRPRRVFVNSMSDLFHKSIPDSYIAEVFAVMALAPQHTFQLLTKRHGRMRSLLTNPRVVEGPSGPLSFEDMVRNCAFNMANRNSMHAAVADTVEWPLPNVWLGVSVEDQKRADLRIPALLATPAAVRFLSCEPILGPVSFRWAKWAPLINAGHLDGLRGIDWVIVGGESGPGHRPIDPEWVRSLRDQCSDAGVAFLFKQWGGATPKAGGRELDGVTHDGYPGAVSA